MKEKIKKVYNLSDDNSQIIRESLSFVETELQKVKRIKRHVPRALLLTEELLVSITEAAPNEGELRVSVRRANWDVYIKISAPGEEIDFDISEDGTSEAGIRSILLDAFSDKLSIAHKKGYNSARMLVGVKSQRFAWKTTLATLLGILVFLVFSVAFPADAFNAMRTNFFDPLSNLLINLLNLFLLPVVFLSIISAASKITSANELNNGIGSKALRASAASSVVATLIGIFAYSVFHEVYNSISLFHLGGVSVGEVKIWDIILGLVPSNIFSPFLENNTLQVIAMAVIIGVCINSVGERSSLFLQATDTLFELVKKIVEAIEKLIPFGIFCTSFSVCCEYGVSVFGYILPAIACMLVAFVAMFVFYMLILKLKTGLAPMRFIKKALPFMQDLLLHGSGVDALPDSMRFCRAKLGISPKVYNVSLPFGAQFNMDGSCIYMAVFGLYLAQICEISLYGSNILAMVFSIVILSMGAPNFTCGNIICLFTLLSSIGLPFRALGVILCFDPLVFLLIAVLNTIGDTIISLIIAYKKGLLNEDIYYR